MTATSATFGRTGDVLRFLRVTFTPPVMIKCIAVGEGEVVLADLVDVANDRRRGEPCLLRPPWYSNWPRTQ